MNIISFFAPVGWVLGLIMFYINKVTNNYGLTLLLFSIIVKVLMIPLGIQQQKGMISSARLQPKMKALQKAYGNNKQKYSEELQKLYNEEGFSPMSSCLPLLIQFPILFGMLDVIGDEEWLKNDFVRIVRNRGSAVIEERGASSAASAASAIVDTVHSIINPTPNGDFHSIGVCSDGSYGTKKGLITSMPIRSDGKNIEIVQGLQISDFARTQIDASVNELQEEADTFNGLAF